MSVQRNDWSLQRKGIIDQERHKERIKDAIKKNLGSIVSNESIILSNGRKTVKVPMRALDEYKFRFDYRKRKHVGQGDGVLVQVPEGNVLVDQGPPEAGVAGQLRRLGVTRLAAIVLTVALVAAVYVARRKREDLLPSAGVPIEYDEETPSATGAAAHHGGGH